MAPARPTAAPQVAVPRKPSTEACPPNRSFTQSEAGGRGSGEVFVVECWTGGSRPGGRLRPREAVNKSRSTRIFRAKAQRTQRKPRMFSWRAWRLGERLAFLHSFPGPQPAPRPAPSRAALDHGYFSASAANPARTGYRSGWRAGFRGWLPWNRPGRKSGSPSGCPCGRRRRSELRCHCLEKRAKKRVFLDFRSRPGGRLRPRGAAPQTHPSHLKNVETPGVEMSLDPAG